jgi:branched-chain amino acid transport system substrate-binding protein
MSGPYDWLGWRQANAVQLSVDQVNAAGGLDIGGTNYTLALVSADSECDPPQVITATNNLLNAGVVAVVGHSCSLDSDAAQPLYAAAGVPMISPSSTMPQLTDQGYTTTFRVISRDDTPPAMLAAHLRNRMAFENAAIVEMDGYFYNEMNDVFSDTFTSLGGTITSRHTVVSTADFTATLTTIMAENPHTIHFVNDDGNTAGLLSQVAHNLGMTNVVIAWTTYSINRGILDDYTTAAGIAAEGDIVAMNYRATDDMPGYNALNADYIAAGFANYGDEAQEWGAFAYDAAQIIIAAIDRADSVNPADIRDEIAATTNYQGVVGIYEGFDTKGDVVPQWAWMERYQNGQWAVIWPYEIFLPIMLKNSGQ